MDNMRTGTEIVNPCVDPLFTTQLLKSLHMGDLCSGGSTMETAHQFYLKCELTEASFDVHKFESNLVDLEVLVKGQSNDAYKTKIISLQ